jgi:hypothetical protein
MRKLILILLLFVSAVVNGQTPAGYIKANMRFKWTAGIFDSALHVPQYNGTPSGIRNGAWVGDGAIGMDTTNHRMYIYSGGAWLRLAKYSEVTTPTWQQTLTAGSTLTGDNTIDGGLNNIDFADFNGFAISVRNNSGIEFNGYNGAKRSAISVAGDSIVLKLNNSGNFYIDSLQNVSTQSVLLGGTSSINNRKIGYLNIGTGLSLSSGTLNSVWTASGNDVYNNNSGNVGIGTTSPDSTLTVIGGLRINNGAAQNNYVWTSTGTDGRGTWKAAAGGATPAGSNKQVQYNNSGAFGGATGVEIGNTNERLSIWQQSSSDVPLTIRTAGDNSKAAIEIKDTTSSPYTSAIKFTPSAGGNPQPSKIYQGYEGLYLDGGSAPYTTAGGATVVIGNSTGSVAPFKVHSYPYDVPASPNNWVAKIRTSKTSAVGLAIDWGQAGQTGDLLQFRNNSNTVMARFDSIGKLGVNTVPVSYVDANGSLGAAITTTSSNITLDATHHTVIITSGTPTITLPAAASSNARRIYVVVNQTGSAVTISSYQNFSGSGTTTVAANSSIQIQSDGSNWYRIL